MTREEFILSLATQEIRDGRNPDLAVAFWAKEWADSQREVTAQAAALVAAQAALARLDSK